MHHRGGIYHIKGIRRFGAISRILIRHGFKDIVDRVLDRQPAGDRTPETAPAAGYPSPVRLRLMLEELGPSFIKLGQILSVRADLFPIAYTEEFKKLQDQVPPVPYAAVLAVIETEQGRPIGRVYSQFSKECQAAASVAQVHRARLMSGEWVAVKVIRPGIEKMIRDDIRVMYFFAERLERMLEIGRIIGFVNLVREFERTIFRELDMYIEAGNMERFAANFRDTHELHVPRVHWEFTSKSVLTMGFISGIKMDQVDAIRKAGIDPKEVAMIGLRSFSRQIMDFGYFHADPHPGNTIVMYDGRVGLVDFGIMGDLDEETMMQIANIFLGYAEHDYDMVMDAFASAGLIDGQAMDLKAFRADLKEMSEPFYGRTLSTISVKDVYEQVMGLAFKYRIRLPRNLLLLLKTFVQTESLGKILGSDASLLEVTRPYAMKLLQRGYDARKLLYNLGRDIKTLGGYLRAAPRLTFEILKRTAEGKHRIALKISGFDPAVGKMERGLNRAIVGVIIAASTIAGSLVLNSPVTVFEIAIAGRPLPITTILGLTGYTIATCLGLWLIVSIFRSGKM